MMMKTFKLLSRRTKGLGVMEELMLLMRWEYYWGCTEGFTNAA